MVQELESEQAVSCESIGMAAPVCLCHWPENSHGLVTLWEIMQGAPIAQVVQTLRSLWIAANFANLQGVKDSFRQGQLLSIEEHLMELDALCVDLKLPMTRLHIKDALSMVDIAKTSSNPSRWEALDRGCMVLTNNLEKEMSLRKYFTVTPERAEIFDKTFGPEVADAFPSTSFDITEASKSFALARSTACVFHLMRVTEIGLAVLAKQFNVPADHTNWHNIIEGIEKALRAMAVDPNKPADWKDQQEFFSQVTSYLMVTKDAWRNYTAHARGKYTEDEAETMLINVRGFMQKLATRLHE